MIKNSILLVVLILLITSPLFAENPTLVFKNNGKPIGMQVDQTTLLKNASKNKSGQPGLVEGALRMLVSGKPGYGSCFPKGTIIDSIETNATGYRLFITLPQGFADTLQDEITDGMMHALGKTMASIDPKIRVEVFARDDEVMDHLQIGELFSDDFVPPVKPWEDGTDNNGPPGYGQGQPAGFLSGKSIFLSPGHGWYYHDTYGWITQRGNTNGIVEDFSNAEPVFQYLAPYLHNAGAGVYPVREQDLNTEMVIIDNTDPGFSTTGTWSANTYVDCYYGTNYMAAQVSATETATATFEADFAEDGFYQVSAWYTNGANRSTDAKITVHHADGETTIIENQQRDGCTWQSLGRYYFKADDPADRRKVVVSNEGSDTASYVIADAVRFGGGMYEDAGKPRWEMSGHYYPPFMGCDSCQVNTVRTMPAFAAWQSETWEDSLYLSWHTNAPNPGLGTSTYAYSSAGFNGAFDGVPGGDTLRDFMQDEVVADLRAGWDSSWTDGGKYTNWFGELHPSYNPDMPAALIEVAFHDTPADAESIKEPEFRKIVAKALYQAVVRYFADRDSVTPLFLPEPPEELAVQWTGGEGYVQWAAPVFDYGGLAGDPADGYRVYPSRTGKGTAKGIDTTLTEMFVRAGQLVGQDNIHFIRVSATNSGGESFPTETLAFSSGDGPRVLIVNGFDRLDKYANVPESYYGGGTIYRGYLDRMNSFDYTIAHARALAAAGIEFDSASNEAVLAGRVYLDDYPAVVWIVGEDSTADVALGSDEQSLLSDYLEGGGGLFISGSEIGWDLWEYGSANDQAFYTDYLRASYDADSSGTGAVDASALSIFSQVADFEFDYQDYEIYAANWPDAVSALAGGDTALSYTGTSYGAAVAADTGTFRVVYLGFPFETIYDSVTREQIMDASMGFLIAGDDDDDDDDDDEGLFVCGQWEAWRDEIITGEK